MFKKLTQKEKILKHLKKRSITSFEAYRKYRITRLSAIIFMLKEDGYNIRSEFKNKDGFVTYSLIKEE